MTAVEKKRNYPLISKNTSKPLLIFFIRSLSHSIKDWFHVTGRWPKSELPWTIKKLTYWPKIPSIFDKVFINAQAWKKSCQNIFGSFTQNKGSYILINEIKPLQVTSFERSAFQTTLAKLRKKSKWGGVAPKYYIQQFK